jgi:hypothetical protein
MAHELGSRDRHPLARLQRYYHTDETLDTNITQRTNQTPRLNLDRRRYGSATQIPATTHGTVIRDVLFVARRRNSKDLQGSRHDPQPSHDGPSEYRWNMSLLLGKSVGPDEVFGISQTFCNEVRSAIQLPSQERRE